MQVSLNAAWNMVSFNILPSTNDSTATVFGTGPTGDFLFVKDNAGNAYCPILSGDNIHYVQIGQGYQVYTSAPDTIRVQGTPVNYLASPINLAAGWNMIGYLPSTDDSVWHAVASIQAQVVILKNNTGRAYWPALDVDDIGIMSVGQGYKVLMSSGVSFTYPAPLSGVAKRTVSGNGPMLLHLPEPQHYAAHGNTGNNATLLAKNVVIDNKTAADGCEIGAYDPAGNLVGAGTVIQGRTAFAVWGNDPVTRKMNGCGAGDNITFKLWDGNQEYPLEYSSANGVQPRFSADGVYLGSLSVPSWCFIKQFELAKAYPNPFRGVVRISFDIPAIPGTTAQNIELNVYDMKGSLVHQVAKGAYAPGHYTVEWSGAESRVGSVGSTIYIVRMRANNFDKRIKLVKVE
jgi:hypothetical protein